MKTVDFKWDPIGTHPVRPALEHQVNELFGELVNLSEFSASVSEVSDDEFVVNIESKSRDNGYVITYCPKLAARYAKRFKEQGKAVFVYSAEPVSYGFYWEARN